MALVRETRRGERDALLESPLNGFAEAVDIGRSNVTSPTLALKCSVHKCEIDVQLPVTVDPTVTCLTRDRNVDEAIGG